MLMNSLRQNHTLQRWNKMAESMSKNIKSNECLIIHQEQIQGKGEDFFLAEYDEDRLAMGVFDGCGGSGAKTYPAFKGYTGAKVAARALAAAVKIWFQNYSHGDSSERNLKLIIDKMLAVCEQRASSGQKLLGSLNREFPSTIAFFVMTENQSTIDFYWCGDSRGYILDENGLHQVTVDDVAVTDAMKNLREDAPMTNVASASRPFEIHKKQIQLSEPAVIFNATDGCFGYLATPMEFEKLVLRTLKKAEDTAQWKTFLEEEIRQVSGDDFSMTLWTGMYKDFAFMKKSLMKRFAYIDNMYPSASRCSEEELFLQWESYKKSYENLWTAGDEKNAD